MADYSMVSFRYSVSFGGDEIGFNDVSGLSLENEVIRYRDGLNKQLGNMKLPGLRKVTDVTLKKGVFPSDNKFYEWIITNHNTLERKDVLVNLLDETGVPKMTWTLHSAWPTKIESPEFKGDSNEVAVESITLAYEEMTIESK
jgi:phage tail-like protein